MPKKILGFVASIFFIAVAAHGQVTINANGPSTHLVLSDSGTALAVGDIVRIGYFSSTTNLATDNSFSDLNSIFTPIGEGSADVDTTFGTTDGFSESGVSGDTLEINNFGSTPGAFLGSFGNVSPTYLATGDQLYMWVFNATSTSAATQWGIFDAPSWLFPASGGAANVSLTSPSVAAIRGSVSGANFELANIPASVPEPTSLAALGSLIALGSAGFLRRRKTA